MTRQEQHKQVERDIENETEVALSIELLIEWLKQKKSAFLPYVNSESIGAFRDLGHPNEKIYIVTIVIPTRTGLHFPTFSIDLKTESITQELL